MEVEKLAVLAFSSARDHWFCWEWTLYIPSLSIKILRFDTAKDVLTLVEGEEKDGDEMPGPKDAGLAHGEGILERRKKPRETASHLEKDCEHFLPCLASLILMFST